MKKIREFFTVICVLVPISLLVVGTMVSTTWIWYAIMIAGIISILAAAIKGYRKAKWENARKTVLFSTLITSVIIPAQALICQLTYPQLFLAEGAVMWTFIVMSAEIIKSLRNQTPNKYLTWALVLSVCLLIFCVVGGLLDMYEYILKVEPEILIRVLGVATTISLFGGVALLIPGLIKQGK